MYQSNLSYENTGLTAFFWGQDIFLLSESRIITSLKSYKKKHKKNKLNIPQLLA
jgi:hypothetical protein